MVPVSTNNLNTVLQFTIGRLVGILHNMNKDIKVHAFCSGMVGHAYLVFAPPERGGLGHTKAVIIQEAEKSGKSAVEVAGKVCSL